MASLAKCRPDVPRAVATACPMATPNSGLQQGQLVQGEWVRHADQNTLVGGEYKAFSWGNSRKRARPQRIHRPIRRIFRPVRRVGWGTRQWHPMPVVNRWRWTGGNGKMNRCGFGPHGWGGAWYNRTMTSQISNVETIAAGRGIRTLSEIRQRYGAGRWRKLKGVATVRLIRRAELHWYEAHGVGKRGFKLKRFLDD